MKDLTNMHFDRLKVLKFDHVNKFGCSYWLCRCKCGKEKVIRGSSLTTGAIRSCGCLNIELSAKRLNDYSFKHGFAHKERLYETWKNMKRRCYDTANKRYANYGGKGIRVCDAWLHDYSAFRSWALSHGYADNLSIDRVNNDGNYEPSNCRWATAKEQENNMSRNHILTYNGISHTISEWADLLGFTYSTLSHRVQRGWSVEQLLNTPARNSKPVKA